MMESIINNFEKKLLDNLKGAEGTLIFDLHEKGMLDIKALEEFCLVAKALNENIEKNNINTRFVARIYMLYSMLWKYIACHFDPDDGFKITNLSPDTYDDVMDLFDSAFDLRRLK